MDCTGRFKGDVIKKVSVYFGNEIDAYFFMSQFNRHARSVQISGLHRNLSDQQDEVDAR